MNPVPFYIPNLIGYGRVLSGIVALWYALNDYWMFLILYGVSQGLDAVDGVAARSFGQSASETEEEEGGYDTVFAK